MHFEKLMSVEFRSPFFRRIPEIQLTGMAGKVKLKPRVRKRDRIEAAHSDSSCRNIRGFRRKLRIALPYH